MIPPYIPVINMCILSMIYRETEILFPFMTVREHKVKNNTRTVRRGNGKRKGTNADIMAEIFGEKEKCSRIIFKSLQCVHTT